MFVLRGWAPARRVGVGGGVGRRGEESVLVLVMSEGSAGEGEEEVFISRVGVVLGCVWLCLCLMPL